MLNQPRTFAKRSSWLIALMLRLAALPPWRSFGASATVFSRSPIRFPLLTCWVAMMLLLLQKGGYMWVMLRLIAEYRFAVDADAKQGVRFLPRS